MNKKKQSGMSMWGAMILLIICVINGFVVIKVAPIYMENMTIQRILESLREPLQQERMPANKIWQSIYRRMIVNSIRGIGRDKANISQTSKKSTISLSYEVRRNLLYNLDVVVSFKNVLEVRRGSLAK